MRAKIALLADTITIVGRYIHAIAYVLEENMGVKREKRISTRLALVYVLEENLGVVREKRMRRRLALLRVRKGDMVTKKAKLI